MGYRLLAELTMLAHFGFLVFVVLGALLVLRWPWLALLHIPAFLWGALISFMGWVCPLTPLENRFLRLSGEEGYDTGFIEHYITGILYPTGLTRTSQIAMGVLVLLLNGALYGWILHRRRKERKGHTGLLGSDEPLPADYSQ